MASIRFAALLLLVSAAPAHAQDAPFEEPYPAKAAGWGPEAPGGRFVSRWAEDWTGKDRAPALKAMPLGGEASLTLSAEARIRYDRHDDAQLARGDDYGQGLFRGIIGADLRLTPGLRFYGELGTARVAGRREAATANFDNQASLQQLFVEIRGQVSGALIGIMLGRQEFSDGPRQLVSLSDGPNLHRSWNGARLYMHTENLRLGAFDFRATRLGAGFLDERINRAERLRGLNASVILARGAKGANIYLDSFWLNTQRPGAGAADKRDTYGLRAWGRRGDLAFDWTLARQTGQSAAWGLFAVQSVALSQRGWKPRIGAHIDIASAGSGPRKSFHQLYASSNYLGDGLFLSASNLLLVAPGLSATPTPRSSIAIEYGFAWRLSERDAAYAGQMRPYAGTTGVPGHRVGSLLRLSGSWALTRDATLFADFERLQPGSVLRRAGHGSGSYSHIGMTIRY